VNFVYDDVVNVLQNTIGSRYVLERRAQIHKRSYDNLVTIL